MTKNNVPVIVNSTVCYLIAFLTTTILHESAHAFSGMLYDSQPVLHHNYVEHFANDNLSVYDLVAIALAGPLLSLTQAIVIASIYINYKRQNLFRLFLLWFSVLGFNNFFGYLMTGPIFKNGDIGKAYLLLESSLWLQILLALLGIVCLTFLAYKLTIPFLRFSYLTEWIVNAKARKRFAFQILILPWLIGSSVITLLFLPIIAIISIIYPVMSGMIFIFPWQNAEKPEQFNLSINRTIGKISIPAIIILLCLMGVFKFVLAPGIQLF